MESDDEDRRGRDRFARERDHRREDDRRDYSNGSLKRPAARRDDYGSAKRGRTDEFDDNVMLSFKRFLATQDDDIGEEQAVAKYAEYKTEFKRQQIQKFFNAHKDEEWFRQKYHPVDAGNIEKAHFDHVQKRLEIFNKLAEEGTFNSISLDLKNAKEIIRIMDTVVVLLEGGDQAAVEALKTEKIEDESLEELAKEQKKNGGSSAESADVSTNPEAASEEEGGEGSDGGVKKKQLHKTSSVFMRTISPSTTQEEIEAICKRSVGFIRVALTDAAPDRKFFRRGWATFRRDVNIKEICWNINQTRVHDNDINAIINRDITRRIRTTNGITAYKQVAQNDLRLAVKLTAMCDKRMGLYGEADQPKEEREKDIRMGVDIVGQSKNPLVKKAQHVLMEIGEDEISPEEEELLNRSGAQSAVKVEDKSVFTTEEAVINALDGLILYLRVVHSVDFYGHLDYPNEDNMPSRCGILHVRGPAPSGSQWGVSDDGQVLVSNKFVLDFTNGFNQRLNESLINRSYISEEEMVKLGKKDPETEVENFIQANTVELAKDKWLCPLSGKKFKGPEFIRKHLLSKHEEKLAEVRQEAEFFNNFLADAKRPADVEVKAPPRDDDRREERFSYAGDRSRPARSSYGGRDHGRPGGRYDDYRRESRPQISYRDLDAPEEIV